MAETNQPGTQTLPSRYRKGESSISGGTSVTESKHKECMSSSGRWRRCYPFGEQRIASTVATLVSLWPAK